MLPSLYMEEERTEVNSWATFMMIGRVRGCDGATLCQSSLTTIFVSLFEQNEQDFVVSV